MSEVNQEGCEWPVNHHKDDKNDDRTLDMHVSVQPGGFEARLRHKCVEEDDEAES